jgi:hypothetical protein
MQMQRLRAVGKLLAVSDSDLRCVCGERGDRLLVYDGVEERCTNIRPAIFMRSGTVRVLGHESRTRAGTRSK